MKRVIIIVPSVPDELCPVLCGVIGIVACRDADHAIRLIFGTSII